jgi:transcriptional regulator with XRE-family HTH domain
MCLVEWVFIMRLPGTSFKTFLEEIMQRRGFSAAALAGKVGVSRATMSRWLSGQDVPSPRSCQKMAEQLEIPPIELLAVAGHLPKAPQNFPFPLPEFREYARQKYEGQLDNDVIEIIEDLIERRRRKILDTRANEM